VREAAMPRLRFLEAAIIEADNGRLAHQRPAVALVGLAANAKMAGAPFAHRLSLRDRFGIAETNKRLGQLSLVDRLRQQRSIAGRAAANVVAHVEQADGAAKGGCLVERFVDADKAAGEVVAVPPQIAGQLVGKLL